MKEQLFLARFKTDASNWRHYFDAHNALKAALTEVTGRPDEEFRFLRDMPRLKRIKDCNTKRTFAFVVAFRINATTLKLARRSLDRHFHRRVSKHFNYRFLNVPQNRFGPDGYLLFASYGQLENGLPLRLRNGLPATLYWLNSDTIEEWAAPWLKQVRLALSEDTTHVGPSVFTLLEMQVANKVVYAVYRTANQYGALDLIQDDTGGIFGSVYLVYQNRIYRSSDPQARPLMRGIQRRIDPDVSPLLLNY